MSNATKNSAVVLQLKAPRAQRVRGHRVGPLVGADDRGPLVDYPGNPHGPLPARSTVPLEGALRDHANGLPREVVLAFAGERSDEPIVVGVLESRAPAPPAPTALPPSEAKVDGVRVVLEARDEIELRCGEASITLRRNGRVVIRGAYVETRSRGVNRIKGGAVQIN
jgi:hypothetical protein